jgi:hypothetical protein
VGILAGKAVLWEWKRMILAHGWRWKKGRTRKNQILSSWINTGNTDKEKKHTENRKEAKGGTFLERHSHLVPLPKGADEYIGEGKRASS